MKALHASWLCSALISIPLHAATIFVGTGTDPSLGNPNTCSLRQAIQASNTHAAVGACNAGSGNDLIELNARQIQLAQPGADEDANLTGDLDINSNIKIEGFGATIDANTIDRIFDVHSGQLDLSDVILTSGIVTTTSEPLGGAILVHGKAALRLSNVEIRSSAANNGGAIFVDEDATLRADSSTLHGNAALRIANSGGFGGAIFTRGLNTTLRNVTLTDNRAERGGGAVLAQGFSQIGKTGPSLVLNNVTISANRASNQQGSGFGGGLATHGHALVYVTNSILIDNQADQYPDCSGNLIALRFNLLPQKLDCEISGARDGNIVYDGVGLAPLWNYGGRVPTMHPRYLSLARDARAGTDPAEAPCESVDARGMPRPAQGACDFGAVEVQDSFHIDTTADGHDANPGDGICATVDGQCTLRAAMEELHAQSATNLQTRTLHIPVGTYLLEYGQLLADFPLILIGDGSRDVIVERADDAPNARVLQVVAPSPPDTLAFDTAAALLEFSVQKGRTLIIPILGGDEAGGIYVYQQNALLYGMEVSDNIAQAGGGLLAWLFDPQTVLIDHSTFHDNAGSVVPPGHGGGAWFHGGSVHVINSTFAYNTSFVGGAGVYVDGQTTVSFSNTTIADNTLVATFPLPPQYGGAGLRIEPGSGAQVSVLNSVLGNNQDTVFPPDCYGDPITAAYSLIQTGNCFVLPNPGLGMIYGVDPLLTPTLNRNGAAPNDRLPQTLSLQPGSPLRDGGAPAGCFPIGMTLAGVPLAKDEDENPRPQGARCDIGAYEASP